MSRPPLTKTAPTSRLLVGAVFVAVSTSALGGIRTPNLLIRSQMLYPLSYERRSLVVLPAVMQACATLSQQHSVDRAFDSPPTTGSCGTCQGYGMAGAVRTGGREEPMSSDATSSASSMREARRARAQRAKAAQSGPPITTFIASWQLALEAAAKSPATVRGYTDSVRWLCRSWWSTTCPPTSKAWTRRTSAPTC